MEQGQNESHGCFANCQPRQCVGQPTCRTLRGSASNRLVTYALSRYQDRQNPLQIQKDRLRTYPCATPKRSQAYQKCPRYSRYNGQRPLVAPETRPFLLFRKGASRRNLLCRHYGNRPKVWSCGVGAADVFPLRLSRESETGTGRSQSKVIEIGNERLAVAPRDVSNRETTPLNPLGLFPIVDFHINCVTSVSRSQKPCVNVSP